MDNEERKYINHHRIGPNAMAAKLKVGVLVVLVVAASAAFAASASTTASIDRSTSADVVADDAGLIGLQANTSTGVVQQNSSGVLTIDFARGDAQGVNTEATFKVGDPNNANSSYAFNITNQNSQSHDVELGYSGATTDGTDNLEFRVYDSTGALQTTATEETASGAVTLAPGETAYVVVVVDTHGLDTSADLSGTLTVSV